MKKIYKIKLKDWTYDEWDSWVVIAENEEEVKKLCNIRELEDPENDKRMHDNQYENNIEYIKEIGVTKGDVKSEIALGSFNAG